MAGYQPFSTGRLSFGNGRPQAQLVDIALVRPPVKAPAPDPRPEPKVDGESFIPPKPVRPEDFERGQTFSMKRLTEIVAAVTGVTALEITCHRRRPHQVKARQLVFWLGKNFTGLSLPQIAQRVGGRDHTTALWGIRKVQAVVDRLDIKKPDCPVAAAELLWATDWSEGPK